jgi:hypothetical protein
VFSFRDWSTGQDDKELERLERNRAAARRYRERHKEEIRERRRRKWQADPVHREKHRVRDRLFQRKRRFREIYGISLADYDMMFARQGGACAICKRTDLKLCVDHCHLTGEVRGLLCIQCNSALGLCNDDPSRLLAAAEYLQAARERQKAQNSRCAVASACSGEGSADSATRTCATPDSMAPVPIPKERDTR